MNSAVLCDPFGSLQCLFHPASVHASQNYEGPETVSDRVRLRVMVVSAGFILS